MADRWDKLGCILNVFTLAVVLLFVYMVVDCWADWRDQHYIRDLQRRIAVLEQKNN